MTHSYALEIGRKIRQTKQMNIRKGKFVGRLAPYGYMKSEADKHRLVLDPYAATIVRTMFEMVAKGHSVTEVLNWLNNSGILPPKRYYHSKGLTTEKDIEGKHIRWNKGGIYTILKNRVYCGDMVQGKYKTQSYVQKSVAKTDWITVPDTHEGIVSRELFDRVQAVWGDTSYATRKPFSDNIFLRKVFCGHCGYSLKRSNGGRNNSKYYLACSTRQVYGKDNCVIVSIGENDLKEAMLALLNKQAEVLGVGADAPIPQQSAKQTALQAELRQAQGEIGKNSHFLKSLYESLMTNDLTQDEYRELKAGYEAKIAALTVKEKDLRGKLVEQIGQDAATAKAASHLNGVRQLEDLTADSIDRLVGKILVYEDKHIEVHFKFTDGFVETSPLSAKRGGGCVEHGTKQAV